MPTAIVDSFGIVCVYVEKHYIPQYLTSRFCACLC